MISTSICWFDPHTPSLCRPEGISQRTPELASSPLAPYAFHGWKSVQPKRIWRTHKGLENHRGRYQACNIVQYDRYGGGSVMVWGGTNLEGCTCMCLIMVIWQVQGTETRSLDLLLGPTLEQLVPGFSWYITMSEVMWQKCANDCRGWGHLHIWQASTFFGPYSHQTLL